MCNVYMTYCRAGQHHTMYGLLLSCLLFMLTVSKQSTQICAGVHTHSQHISPSVAMASVAVVSTHHAGEDGS